VTRCASSRAMEAAKLLLEGALNTALNPALRSAGMVGSLYYGVHAVYLVCLPLHGTAPATRRKASDTGAADVGDLSAAAAGMDARTMRGVDGRDHAIARPSLAAGALTVQRLTRAHAVAPPPFSEVANPALGPTRAHAVAPPSTCVGVATLAVPRASAVAPPPADAGWHEARGRLPHEHSSPAPAPYPGGWDV
jgi:hypothetical protein